MIMTRISKFLYVLDSIVKKLNNFRLLFIHSLIRTQIYPCKLSGLIIFIFCLPVSLLQPSLLRAQTYEMEFHRISIEMGLSQSSIFAIMEDRQGFLWFGTQDGLNKYDGYTFKIFKHIPADSSSISDNWITSICEDHLGNIWIGTSGGGLNKFDPIHERFTTYQQEINGKNELEYNRVQVVFEDSDRYLWIGTEGGGLSRFNPSSAKFTHFIHDPNNAKSISDNRIRVILEDQAGNLWIGTYGGGLSVLKKENKDAGMFYKYVHHPNDMSTLSSNCIQSLYTDSIGNLWVGTDDGLNLYDPEKKQFKRYKQNPGNPNSLSNNVIYTIYEDVNHILWIGTDFGLNFYDQVNDRFWQTNHDPSNAKSLSNDLIRVIFKDASGTIWVGTYGGGLNQYDGRKKKFRHYKNVAWDPNSINNNNVWSILVVRSGHLWIGTNKGLNKINRNRGTVEVFRHNPLDPYSLGDDIVRVIYEDSRGELWFGTNNAGLNRFNPLQKKFKRYIFTIDDSTSISNNTIRAIFEDKNGSLWIGTWGGLNLFDVQKEEFIHYTHNPDDANSLSDNRVRCLLEDTEGILWVGTYKGLNKFDRNRGKFEHYINNPNDSTSLSHDRVLALHQGKNGIIWITTYGGGLNKFDPKTERFTAFTEKNGLPNNAVYGILEDDNGNIWLSTNKGLSKFNPGKETFKNFDVNDGLQSDEFNGGAYAKDRKGEMFFGGINGYNSFFPNNITENNYIPPVVLTSFKIFDLKANLDSSISIIKNISLFHKDNFFAFEFAALDYTNPEKNEYSYKLEGFDQNWIRCGNRRYANYTNLDGGDYIFKVKGSNSDGIWNEVDTSVKIHINPPYWATWWFRILLVLMILLISYGVYHYRFKKIEIQKKYLEDQIAERTWEIKERNRQLIFSMKETDNILHNIEEGIFLLNEKYNINSQYSSALESILEQKKLARCNFIDLLENTVTHKIHQSTQEFIELMFNDSVDEETLINLNPLSEMRLTFENGDSKSKIVKDLVFKFRRIPSENGKTKELIATVRDISNQIRLTRELEESQEYSKKQIEWLLSILHIEPQLLEEFLEGANLELNYIDNVLKGGEKEADINATLEKIFRSMHLIKGNASLIDLKFFVEKAHEFEDNISHIKDKTIITGSDFVPLVLMLKEMRPILIGLESLVGRIGKIHVNFRPKRSYEKKVFISSLQNLLHTLAGDLNKKIELDTDNFDPGHIPYRFRLLTRQILIQLIRNSVYHGIEKPEERKEIGKNPVGRIEIMSMASETAFGFRLSDDGRGIQIDKLRSKAKSSGLWDAEDIEQWNDQQVAETIYTIGISTLDRANLVAGRGIGMDLVKDKITKAGGEIMLNFEDGRFCEFSITIPVNSGELNKTINEEELVTV
jgi:ligand-binding sensor domain-containing protein